MGFTYQFEKPNMPIIDVSQNSYRSLVKAAHERGMSIDRFIQGYFSSDTQLVRVLNNPVRPEFMHRVIKRFSPRLSYR